LNPFEYLDVYNKIDISLDPFPFGGGTVSYESLWMGVPILTMLGASFMGRLCGSLMKQVGLSNWIVNSRSDYISLAISLSSNLAELDKIRRTLRQQAQLSIFDGAKYTRGFESALLKVWGDYIKN
jgi:predicted O-linked N-acetylglucosamine transferase (SPINDLY family)